MFLGTHAPRLDEKSRLILPARFREELAGGVRGRRAQVAHGRHAWVVRLDGARTARGRTVVLTSLQTLVLERFETGL